MRRSIYACMLITVLSSAAAAQTERRELGPHVHGSGTLNIVIEGNNVSMDLSAPANDILGFEHQPSTPEHEKILASAKAALEQPLTLIELPVAAGCKVETANVTFNAAEPAATAAPAKPAGESQHADFDVDYALTCAAPNKITQLSFAYFKQFAGAQKLAVTIVSDKGQTQYEVTRDKPVLTLK